MVAEIKITNEDCMDLMARYPDKHFELAIVDPPYGIGNFVPQANSYGGNPGKLVDWNDYIPTEEYFSELIRVSKNRIVWGANYYNSFEPNRGAIVWYKGGTQGKSSKCEIASQSFYKKIDYIHINWQSGFFRANIEHIIHACQKPVALYKWLLKNYAKPGDKILDTHLGSGSIAIACHDAGYDLTACEIDKDYYEAAMKRLRQHQAQMKLELM